MSTPPRVARAILDALSHGPATATDLAFRLGWQRYKTGIHLAAQRRMGLVVQGAGQAWDLTARGRERIAPRPPSLHERDVLPDEVA